MRWRKILCTMIAISLVGCVRMGQATPQDKARLDDWSKLVTEKDRTDVQRQAASHTEWMEAKKVQWMTAQYRSRYNRQQARKATTQAATRPTTTPGS